jgi:hypothetical protein
MPKSYWFKRTPPPAWVFKPPHIDAVERLANAIRDNPSRNLFDELLDPLRVQSALEPDAATQRLPRALGGALPKRAPPWHTADELFAMWPLISRGLLQMGNTPPMTAAKLAHRLAQCKVPVVRNADGSGGFIWRGKRRVYLYTTVPAIGLKPITQETFNAVMAASFGD